MHIYFCVYPRGDRSKIRVVDLMNSMWEKNDWSVVDPFEFDTREEAIKHARQLARKFNLTYKMFKSRYDSTLDEYLGEFA